MATANEELRAARQRTASPGHPGECLSRQELAELVNAWIWDHYHTRVEASANYIGQLERGTIRWPGKLCREALRVILSAPRDSDLGFINARSRRGTVKLGEVKRKKFIQTTALGGVSLLALEGPVAALLDLLGGIEPRVPARVGATEIEQTRSATQVFQSWSLTYGGKVARETVRGQLRWSAGLLYATCPTRLRPELLCAVGCLAKTAGYMALDADAHEESRRAYHFALACAEAAKDWPLRADVLGCMSHLAIRTGQPDEGLTLAEQALVRPDRLTATGLSMLHTDRARALAKMRRVQETLTAIGTAEDHFTHSTPDHDPLFIRWNAAALATNTGQALFDLAMLGHHPGQATDRLAAAAAGHSASALRPRVISLAKLASLTMVTGDPLQAASIGHQALSAAGTLRSHRATEELRELSRYAATHQNLDDIAHLRHRIGILLVRTGSP